MIDQLLDKKGHRMLKCNSVLAYFEYIYITFILNLLCRTSFNPQVTSTIYTAHITYILNVLNVPHKYTSHLCMILPT